MVDSFDDISFLLEGAELNDYLLQSYRNFHLILQSIFIAIGTGLLLAILAYDDLQKSILVIIILITIAMVSIWILIKMYRIVIARGEDVSFWHRKIIHAEQDLLPEKRYFTQFKIHQRLHKANADHLKELFLTNRKITDKEINLLVEGGLGHTRKILDKWLFIGVGIIWIILIAISIGYTIFIYISGF